MHALVVWVNRVSTRLCCFIRCHFFLKRGRWCTILAGFRPVQCILRLVVVAGVVGRVCARSKVRKKHVVASIVVLWLVPLRPTNLLLLAVGMCMLLKRTGKHHPKSREFSRSSRVSAKQGLPEAMGGPALPKRPFSFDCLASSERRKSVQARKKEERREPADGEKMPKNKGVGVRSSQMPVALHIASYSIHGLHTLAFQRD